MKYASARASIFLILSFLSSYPANGMARTFSKCYRASFFKKIKGDDIRGLVTTNIGQSVRINKKRFFKKKGFGPKGRAILLDAELSSLSKAVYLKVDHKRTKTGAWDVGFNSEVINMPAGRFSAPTLTSHQHIFGLIKATRKPETSLD